MQLKQRRFGVPISEKAHPQMVAQFGNTMHAAGYLVLRFLEK
jgi:hypothetical protein